MYFISNSNWTEWSTIQGVIARVITKSDEREARGRFENTSATTPSIVRHEVKLLINPIYNKFRNKKFFSEVLMYGFSSLRILECKSVFSRQATPCEKFECIFDPVHT